MSSTAYAVPVNHGDFSSQSVDFAQVTEFGFAAPTVGFNQLRFFPSVFGAQAVGGASDSNTATLTLGVDAAPGFTLSELAFTEIGTYNLAGVGTAASQATVTGSVSGQIVALDSGTLATPILFSQSFDFSPSNGDFDLVDDVGLAVIWSGSLNIDLDALVAAAGFAGSATEVGLDLENLLAVQTEAGSAALIVKNDFKIQASTALAPGVIPEPRSVVLMVAGILCVLVAVHRWQRPRAASSEKS